MKSFPSLIKNCLMGPRDRATLPGIMEHLCWETFSGVKIMEEDEEGDANEGKRCNDGTQGKKAFS